MAPSRWRCSTASAATLPINQSRRGAERLDKSFRIIAFDWDGTAVEHRAADGRPVASRVEELMKSGTYIAVITGTNFDNINRQLCRLIEGPHKQRLYVLANRGSEVFGFDVNSEPVLIYRREPSEQENRLLNRVVEGVRDWVKQNSEIDVDIVYDRFSRRKIDMIPEPKWSDPPKSEIEELLHATQERLTRGRISGGIKQIYDLAQRLALQYGLADAKVTTDVKFIEVGLTDKSDSARWIINVLAPKVGARPEDIIFLGDEFGPIAGLEGCDFKMVIPEAGKSVFVSVGREPNGVPGHVLHLGGGPAKFLELLDGQIAFLQTGV
jgi:hydroxymethylpyrimidine pyrophosphatase-like HAD family hydrolase